MKTRTKALLLAMCAVLLVATTVMATLAYLTSTTDPVKNTFTFGLVKITLDEANVNTDGTPIDGAERVKANKYHLIPNHTYVKDPVVHVDENSENCWLFVKLTNGLVDIIDATTIEDQMKANGWTEIDADIWAYKEICGAKSNIPTFTKFTLKDDANVSSYGGATIEVTAYAVQADGFGTAAEAWNATFGAN